MTPLHLHSKTQLAVSVINSSSEKCPPTATSTQNPSHQFIPYSDAIFNMKLSYRS